jgi:hypothetical protein
MNTMAANYNLRALLRRRLACFLFQRQRRAQVGEAAQGGATVPKNAPPSGAIDRYPRPWDLSEPLGPICAAMEAATVAIEYDGVGALMRMNAVAKDDAERMAIVLDIEELIGDIQNPHEWESAVPVTRELVQRFERLVGGVDVDLDAPLPKDPETS